MNDQDHCSRWLG